MATFHVTVKIIILYPMELEYYEINSISTSLLLLVRMNLLLMLVRRLGCSMQHFETTYYFQNLTMRRGKFSMRIGYPSLSLSYKNLYLQLAALSHLTPLTVPVLKAPGPNSR